VSSTTPLPPPGPPLPIPRTPLIGRDWELDVLHALLLCAGVGLVTLTGAGGSGKTRLALAAAARAGDAFPDGTPFVELAPIVDPNLVAPAIAQALGLQELPDRPLLEVLAAYLQPRRLLLVLDNFEHLLSAAPAVGYLVRRCPTLTVLATSRASLRLQDEHEFPVPPLALPDTVLPPSPEEVARVPAVAFFTARAAAARPSFALTEVNTQAVVEICRRLDGLPLAIELAAARTRVLSPGAILQRLGSRLTLLTGGSRDLPARQRTMRDTIAWSYDLLDAEEQRLFRRLAVFVGGWTLEAARDVCEVVSLDSLLDQLTALMDKSLLVAEVRERGEPRFAMLETIREFGLEQLAAGDVMHDARRRHAAHYLALAEMAEPGLRSGERDVWLTRLRADHDNLRAALRWCLEQDDATAGLRLAGALAWYWNVSGQVSEGRAWLEAVLAPSPGSDRTAARAKALYGAGLLAWNQGEYDAAERRCLESAALWQKLDVVRDRAYALLVVGLAARDRGDIARGRALLDESLALFRAADDGWGTALALVSLGRAAILTSDGDAAATLIGESAALWRELGDAWGRALALSNLALLATRQRAWEQAAALYGEGLALFSGPGDALFTARCLQGLAVALAAQGDDVRAARLMGAAEILRERIGAVPPAGERAELAGAIAGVRRHLAPERFAAAWAEGRTTPLARLIDEVQTDDPAAHRRAGPEPAHRGAVPAGLTEREAEVLRLLAAGRTNKEIAQALVVSVRTVENHLTHIYGKIGARSRAEAVAFALHHDFAGRDAGAV
jgi:predicted ATPase/DNA-binding CsgD family transcriptional regulator